MNNYFRIIDQSGNEMGIYPETIDEAVDWALEKRADVFTAPDEDGISELVWAHPDEHVTFSSVNPWSRATVNIAVSDIMQAIKTFASIEECEIVNEHGTASDVEWISLFIAEHGKKRFNDIVHS